MRIKNLLWLFAWLLFLAGSCKHQQTGSSSGSSQLPALLTYEVKGCAEMTESKLKSEPQRISEPEIPEVLSVTVTGDSLIYSRSVVHLCCRKVKLTSEQNTSSITITEDWRGIGCKCRCNSQIHAAVVSLKPGAYRVFIVMMGTDPADSQMQLPRDTTWRGEVQVK
ncbi:MAG: hypothetical protein ABL872_03070 [Lacibacter sp.]